jgi:periplasmic protein TonB
MPKNFVTGLTRGLVLLALTGAVQANDTKAIVDSSSPCAPPEYPRASLSNEEKGVVSVGVLVGVDGKVVETKVEKSSGYRGLDRAATTAFGKCKFKAATKDGKADQQWASIIFEFKLE